eukprot:m.184738 g.184738  ORF g.184738 m.184738 type:complete len:82 (+) comp13600_c3_seq5:3656-3901(+)
MHECMLISFIYVFLCCSLFFGVLCGVGGCLLQDSLRARNEDLLHYLCVWQHLHSLPTELEPEEELDESKNGVLLVCVCVRV